MNVDLAINECSAQMQLDSNTNCTSFASVLAKWYCSLDQLRLPQVRGLFSLFIVCLFEIRKQYIKSIHVRMHM